MANVEKYRKRHYLFSDDQKYRIKMIPEKYLSVATGLVIEDVSKIRLTLGERLQLEIRRFKRCLQLREPYVYEIIEGRVFKAIRYVSVKFGSDRHEGNFDGVFIVVPKELFDMAKRALYPYFKIKSMS